ncbi:MAG TPA: hypothetical protein VHT53_08280 [Candidatus Elarobacter sp.]|jgi:hypothetical protein|nr:hypothetical protein [Candidatus Elarobacter sp.]
MATGSITIPVPANTTVGIVGITNSGGWSQQITVAPSWTGGATWTGTGNQANQIIGTMNLPPYTGSGPDATIQISMAYNEGGGFVPSAVETDSFDLPGLDGYVVGGQDGGGRKPDEPAYHNTVAFVYFSPTY